MTTGKTPRRSRRRLLEDELLRWMSLAPPSRRARKTKKKAKKRAVK
jgi:hypothetical protein